MSPKKRNVSRVTAGATRCKARPLLSEGLRVPRVPRASSASGAPAFKLGESDLVRVTRLVTLLPGSGRTCRGPGPMQSPVPCQRAGVAGPRLLVGTPGPGPGPGSVPVLAAPSQSVYLACDGGLRPGDAHGAGPLTRRSEVSDTPARPLPSLRRRPASLRQWPSWAVHWPHPLAFGPWWCLASCFYRPEARKYQSRLLARPAGDSLATGTSRASRQYPVLCWPTGC